MKNKFFVLFQIMSIAVLLAFTVFAAQPGTEDDPIVSKSYVDERISYVLSMISGTSVNPNASGNEEIVNQVVKEVEPLIALLTEDTAGSKYVPVSASAGQIILGGEGTEIILRSGRAFAYITGASGIVNATAGSELVHNNEIKKNNIIIIPRDDGRGVRIVEDAWFIIKGSYTIN